MHFFFKNKSTIKILFVNICYSLYSLARYAAAAAWAACGVAALYWRRGVRRSGGQLYVCNTSRYRYYTITKLVVLFKVIDTYIVFMCAVYVLCNRAVGRFQNRGVG